MANIKALWLRVKNKVERVLHGPPVQYPRMSLYVLSACSLACSECIMQNLMAADKAYQMSLEEIDRLLAVGAESGYKFDFTLTGGEPLLWRHLGEGIRRLRRSPVTNSITIFSNVTHIHQVNQELMDNLDHLRISEYPTNHENTALLLKKYPGKASKVDREEFWPNPPDAMEGTLPARCNNPEVMLYNYQVYACPHSLSIAIHHKVEGLKLAAPLEKGFMGSKEQIRHGQEQDICTRCISNLNVRDRIAKVHNEAPLKSKRAVTSK